MIQSGWRPFGLSARENQLLPIVITLNIVMRMNDTNIPQVTLSELIDRLRRDWIVVVSPENLDAVAQIERNEKVTLNRREPLGEDDSRRRYGHTHTLRELNPYEPPIVGDVLKMRPNAKL